MGPILFKLLSTALENTINTPKGLSEIIMNAPKRPL